MNKPRRVPRRCIIGAVITLTAGSAQAARHEAPGCATAGLDLPAGFCATVFAAHLGQPRQLAVGPQGTVFANLNDGRHGHDLVALTDDDADGRADTRVAFGQGGATGLIRRGHWLYSAGSDAIRRYRLTGRGAPTDDGQRLVIKLPRQPDHSPIGLAVDDHDQLYVALGALSNACQSDDLKPEQPGRDPCPERRRHAGVWRFAADNPDQRFTPDARFASGLRRLFALAWQPQARQLVGLVMGRDQLHALWPEHYDIAASAAQPAEVLYRITSGEDYGWPYCYYDGSAHAYRLNPEYGGNGQRVGRCGVLPAPDAIYPAHWAPMALVFDEDDTAFPPAYRNGAFIAFHGSWDRAPEPQAGFQVIFQPYQNGRPSGSYQSFAGPQGFTSHALVRSPTSAAHRPSGLAIGPHGALYVADDQGGTIYRITYAGAAKLDSR